MERLKVKELVNRALPEKGKVSLSKFSRALQAQGMTTIVYKNDKAVYGRNGQLILIDSLQLPVTNYLTCFDIHKSYKQRILNYLKKKGVTSNFIYPDPKKMIESTLANTLT